MKSRAVGEDPPPSSFSLFFLWLTSTLGTSRISDKKNVV